MEESAGGGGTRAKGAREFTAFSQAPDVTA